ncbi:MULTISPECIES: hypothetical protein [unclassified Pseudoalteromonas]|uniref:DegT/DnrJ/EryC1/StrS aminotransferase family protein n=1 Tax=Pseudoalteromonas sp. SD03 TaxID=3231719 RepID=A0AB39ARL7_9GAMM|nr:MULTISPECIES: hypothetical protein [unclassified Pseudoalteromonas]MDN3396823.1 hypothetical protein [Pseudoalteromonas sp. APC 3215]MDN3406992.1 hypothetical protein [Pseudoalteromonas sp. APC 3218]MDN3472909.1 hypothetical protein [Pseudoalteromonas sp. APC 4026]SFT95442.1 hypothetical protein SAMN04487870_2664 [Pseudoalteromonas sp. DSM 26666]|tara:strand:+ start:4796 stop:5746 length:951 start_codon:yes stop_codon:yes gene_type:complete
MAIGGYNQLPLISLDTQLGADAYQFQSARAALYAYLNAAKIKTLYVPNYICDSIFPALKSLTIEVKFYSVNEQLLPESCPKQINKSNSRILLVNYFGLLNEQIKTLTAVSPELFIVDNSQALFSEHIEGTTSIYSPRKFLGIPDGGLLRTEIKINMPEALYDASENVGHLLLRAAGDVQAGYVRFLAAEQALECFIPKKISVISAHLIKCADINAIKEKRRRNYKILYNEFKSINQLNLPVDEHVPLCYPLKISFNVASICKELVSSAVYLPRYWCSYHSGSVGKDMFENTLFLPVDERISTTKLLQLVKLIRNKL